MKTYFALLLVALFIFAVATFLFLMRNFFDRIRQKPNNKILKLIKLKSPRLGGVGILIVLAVGLLAGSFKFGLSFLNPSQFVALLLSLAVAFLLGFLTDLKKMKLRLKIILQIVISILLIGGGLHIESFDYDLLNYAVTILWTVWLLNAISSLNSMTAIATIVSAFTVVFFMLHLAITGYADSLSMILLGSMWAALMAFVFFNWFPAQLGLGESGSQLTAVFLAAFSILICWNGKGAHLPYGNYQGWIVALLVFLLPALDTAVVIVNRKLERTSLWKKQKDQLAWQIQYIGIRKNLVAAIFSFFTVIHFTMAVIAAYYIDEWTKSLCAVFAGYAILLFLTFFLITRKNFHRKKYSY